MSRPDLQRVAALAAGVLVLNCALFLPAWVAQAGHADFTPFFPDEHPHGLYGWDLRSAWEYVKALGLRRANADIFRICVEVEVAIIALLLLARWRHRVWVRVAAVTGYILLLLFLIYHHAILYFFNRTPVLLDDAPLALNLIHLLTDLASPARIALGALALVALAGVAIGGWLLARALESWSAEVLHPLRAPALVVISLALAHAGASLLWFGVGRDDPVVQLPSKVVVANVRESRSRATDPDRWRGAPPPEYLELLEAPLPTTPDVYLLVIEAYGEVLLTSELETPTRALLGDVERRLAESGYLAAAAISRAPVYGGGSWMSVATLQTGIRIHRQPLYDEVTRVAGEYPHLTRFFAAHGYHTISVQPGNTRRPGLPRQNLYGWDASFDGPDLGYTGPEYGWAGIPDQYSLGYSRDEILANAPRPHFYFHFGVTTHAPWDRLPARVADWRTLNESARTSPGDSRYAIPATVSTTRQRYFRSIEYAWQVVADFTSAIESDDALVIVLGDHQPAFRGEDRASYHAPIHVLSRDPRLIDRFATRGFTSGLIPGASNDAALRHQDLYPLLAEVLQARESAMVPPPQGGRPHAH